MFDHRVSPHVSVQPGECIITQDTTLAALTKMASSTVVGPFSATALTTVNTVMP